ncbi:MAG: 5'-deoxyadenosine deaminase [Planctomycetes bacterium]|nr:5'-deoxyadenosine deaminase [Planctomycetota bacterium]MBI3846503.1 5'-deoxyadenosine deaminase [Planctomycetota bacterium]
MPNPKTTLLRGATLLTMNGRREIARADLVVRGRTIVSVGKTDVAADETIDLSGRVVMPGLVQTHVHLCQTLFRGEAEDLTLLDWLRTRIWPLEASHDKESIHASALLGCAELLRGGTTAILTLESVHETDSVFRAADESGIYATIGKSLVDEGEGYPSGFRQTTEEAVAETLDLFYQWHEGGGGRLHVAFAPRFALSTSAAAHREALSHCQNHDLLIHTHASENRDEVAEVRRRTGLGNVEYLDSLGLLGPRLCAAHVVWPDDKEMERLAATGTRVLHCPGSNLKLGSGIAPICEMIERGIEVSLGADGAACNNRLDGFEEMRLAGLLQSVRRRPGALPAMKILEMATIGGARTLGLDKLFGSIEPGKRANLVALDLDGLHHQPGADLATTIVYGARAEDVVLTMVDGEVLYRNGKLAKIDEGQLADRCREAKRAVFARAGVPGAASWK